MNVNHTVDSAEPDDGSEEAPEMKSKPNFEIDLVKTGGKTLSFSCSFAPPPEAHDPQSPSEEAYGKLTNCRFSMKMRVFPVLLDRIQLIINVNYYR